MENAIYVCVWSKKESFNLGVKMRGMDHIWTYIRGKRNGKEANRLERDALSDPFLFEALEGLSEVEADHEKALDGLDLRIRAMGKGKTRKITYRWAVAASCLLIVGMTAWLILSVPRMDIVPELAVLQSADSETKTEAVTVAASSPVKEVAEVVEEKSTIVDETHQKSKSAVTGGGKEKVKAFRKKESTKEESNEILVQAEVVEDTSVDMEVVADRADNKKSDTLVLVENKKLSVEEMLQGKLKNTDLKAFQRNKTAFDIRIRGTSTWLVHFENYVSDSIRMPEEVKRGEVTGVVRLSIRVNRERQAKRVDVIEKLSPACDREAMRLVKAYKGVFGDGNNREVIVSVPFAKLSH